MRKNGFLLLLLCFSFMLPGVAQFNTTNYQLENYKAPNLTYRRLGTDFSLQTATENSFGNWRGNVNGRLSYYVFKNNAAFQKVANAHLGLGAFSNERYSTTSSNLFYASSNRNYNGKKFWSIHPTANVAYRYSDERNGSNLWESAIASNFEGYGSVFFGAGSGRVEPVGYARRAMDILNMLKKNDRLTRSPSKSDVEALANTIAEVENRRFYDARYKRIFQLEQIDNTLQELELISDADMTYAANVADVWGYVIAPTDRSAGKRWEYGIKPFGFYQHDWRKGEVTSHNIEETAVGAIAELSYSVFKPLNYTIQSDFKVYANGGGYTYRMFESYESEVWNGSNTAETKAAYELGCAYTLGINPNTRTFMSLGVDAYLANSLRRNPAYLTVGGSVNLSAYYYISPRFRLNGEARLPVSSDDDLRSRYAHKEIYRFLGYQNGSLVEPNNIDARISLSYQIF